MINNKKVSVSQVINSSLVRYEEMHKIVQEAFTGSTANHLDIYVDINSLIKSLYSRENEVYIEDYAVVSSCLINLCAHYRAFFDKYPYNVSTTFYLVYSDNCSNMYTDWWKDYNKTMKDYIANKKIIRNLILQNLNLLSILCPYLPDIHFIIEPIFDSGVIMQYLIDKNKNSNSASMVITKDLYEYQLINNPNTIVLRPKKANGIDKSYYINGLNIFQILAAERNNKIFTTPLSSELLSSVYCLSSCITRNIYSVYNLKQAVSILEKAVENGYIINRYNSDPYIIYYEGVLKVKPNAKLTDDEFIRRFQPIDIPFQTGIYTSNNNSINISNLTDPETVKSINNKYFRKVPLDLNRL